MLDSRKVKGFWFFLAWFFAGSAISAETADRFWMYSMGGNYDPPAIWSFFRDVGLTVMPIMLVFGGLPAAIQIAKGRAWKTIALLSFASCAITYVIIQVVVVWGPSIWGWWW